MRSFCRRFVLSLALLLAVATAADAQNPFLQNRGKRTIERIDFVGNETTREYVLRRELGFAEGDEYDPERVTTAHERLEALPFVGFVELITEKPGPGKIEILFRITEEPRFHWAPDLEYSRRHDKAWIWSTRIGWDNLSGRGESLDLEGFVWKRRGGQLTWVNPWILGDAHLGVFAQARLEEYDWVYEPFAENRFRDWGFRAGVWRMFPYDMQVMLSGEWRETELEIETGGIMLQDPALELSLIHDSRDARFYPTRGVFAEITERFASGDGELDSYATTTLRASGFYSVPYLEILAGHAAYRLTSNPLPLYEQSFFGGPMSVRGVDFGSVRGDDSFRASLEIRRPIAILPLREGRSIGLGVHAFHDWGKAWFHEASFDDVPIRYSYGLGAHFNLNTRNYRFEWAHTDEGDNVFSFEDTFSF